MVCDLGVIEDDSTHANNAVICDGAAAQNRPVTHGAEFAHGGFLVYHGVILNVGAFPDVNGADISPEHGIMPDVYILFQCDITGDDSGGSDFTMLLWAYLLLITYYRSIMEK